MSMPSGTAARRKLFIFADESTIAANADAWQVAALSSLAKIKTAAEGDVTLGVAIGQAREVSNQIAQKI